MGEEYEELAKDMINFLNETGQYHRFVDWMVERGNDKDQLE